MTFSNSTNSGGGIIIFVAIQAPVNLIRSNASALPVMIKEVLITKSDEILY